MKEKFNELFPYGIVLELSSIMQIQNRCDELTEEQVLYIENSTYMFEDMYRMLESIEKMIIDSKNEISLADSVVCISHDLNLLLAKARGE